MSRELLSCTRCGHEGPEGRGPNDVEFRLASLEDEAAEDGGRVGTVEVEQVIEHRHITERVRTTVPERFSTEARCNDRAACRDRVAEARRPAETAPAVDEEAAPWL